MTGPAGNFQSDLIKFSATRENSGKYVCKSEDGLERDIFVRLLGNSSNIDKSEKSHTSEIFMIDFEYGFEIKFSDENGESLELNDEIETRAEESSFRKTSYCGILLVLSLLFLSN